MTPFGAESLPEPECEILVREREKIEGQVCANPFPSELSLFRGGWKGRACHGEKKQDAGAGVWELLGCLLTRSGSVNVKASGSPECEKGEGATVEHKEEEE